PGEVHDVPGVAVGDDGKHEHLVRDRLAGPDRDPDWTDEVHVERQVVPVLLDRPARDDAHLALLDRVVDLGPGQFFVAILRPRACHERVSRNSSSSNSGRFGFIRAQQMASATNIAAKSGSTKSQLPVRLTSQPITIGKTPPPTLPHVFITLIT